jgi:hypothetical protein
MKLRLGPSVSPVHVDRLRIVSHRMDGVSPLLIKYVWLIFDRKIIWILHIETKCCGYFYNTPNQWYVLAGINFVKHSSWLEVPMSLKVYRNIEHNIIGYSSTK